MKKLLLIIPIFLFLFSGTMYSHDPKKKYHQSDKERERYARKLERWNKKQQAAFFKKQHTNEVRKGKHSKGDSHGTGK